MAEALAIDLVEKMEKIYPTISESKNSEVRFRWIRVGLKVDQISPKLKKYQFQARYENAIDNALAMVTEQGRMKFTRPLYRDLGSWEKGS